jgi:putative ABC transport system permease protein
MPGMKLLLNLVRKDLSRNRVIAIALASFLVLSALLMAGGLRVAGTMISSMNGLNEIALPPEYLQMHKGAYDEKAFEEFVESHDYIRDALIVKMLTVNNADIRYHGETLEKCLMDNSLVVQNERFDHLLTMENEIAVIRPGEIGVPVYYAEVLGIQTGEVLTFQKGGRRFDLTVSTIIRDASMNSALTSSKRFLINQADLDEISPHLGEWEYMFEFLLEEDASASVLGKDYLDSGMPGNGVAITGGLLAMLNALSHGLVAFMIIAISMLLILISILCLSYIISATLAEENHTIGEMKAVGFPGKAIEKLYQMKYIILVVVAGIIGYLAAIPFGHVFSSTAILYCGVGSDEWMKWVFPLIGVLILILIVLLKCRGIVRKNLKRTVVELMRGEENRRNEGHYFLPSKGLKKHNITIAFGELKCKWKEYVVVFLVYVFAAFLILLPMNMKNTVEHPSFITYMGVGICDIRLDIPYNGNLKEEKDDIIAQLENDPQIEKYSIYRNGYVQVENAVGEWEYIRVENGDVSVFPLEYFEGRAPDGKQEIALSYLNANALGKEIGDTMTAEYQGKEFTFTVTGIYQDITYGGKTAKAYLPFDEEDVEAYIIYLDVTSDVAIEEKTDELRSILSDGKVTPISEFVAQTLGGIMDNMGMVEGTAIGISLLLILLITVMFLQLVTAREHSAIAIKKAIGFSNRDIRMQFGIRILTIQLLAIATGTMLSKFLGEAMFGWILSSMGASRITMLIDPVEAFLLWPAVQALVVFITVIVGTGVVKRYHIRDQIIE